ncbi:hypothetical protein TRVL_06901 [Trypanosoma vivax]|nr:hypothetical protein TRVL_06901 [Trypanosoma vivax]
MCHSELLWRNCVAAEGKLYRAPGRPQHSHCRLGRSAKNIRGGPAHSSTLRAIAGAEATMVRRVIAKVADGERLAALGVRALEKILRPYAATANSIKRGALVHAAAARVEHDLDPRAPTQLGKHAGTPGLPCGTARCPGP